MTNGLKWRFQQSQIPLIFVCDDGVVTTRDELVQKCSCLEVRHEPQNVEQALRRATQKNGLNMPEACLSIAIACGHDVRKGINTAQLLGHRSSSTELPTADLAASAACHQLLLQSDATDVPEVLELLEQDGEELCRALQRPYLTSCRESFETLDQCAFAALIATLSAETGLLKGRLGQPLHRSQCRGAQDGGLLVTDYSPTELASKVVAQGDTDELDRTLEDQDERRRANERRKSNAENEVEGEFVPGDGHGENQLEASTNEEDGWTLAEEHEDIQDDVAFVDGAWNENAAVFEQKDPLDTVLALDADDAASNDEVVKEAETVAVEGEAVDFPEVDADRKDEATLRDVVTKEVLAPARGAPPTGWRVDLFPQGPGRMRLVSTCEPELWLIIGKAAQREMRANWQTDGPDAFAGQEERRSSWRRAKRGGVVACGVVAGSGELPGSGSVGDGHACLPRALAVRAIDDDPAVSSDGGLLAQCVCRRHACVETLVRQARALILSGIHGHVFLELCCASDSELAAAVVEHSVAIRVTSSEDLQLTSTRPALHRLLRICKAYDVVVNIWVSIPSTADTPFRRINEKLGAETGDFAMTYKLLVAAVGLCLHAVQIGGGFSWE